MVICVVFRAGKFSYNLRSVVTRRESVRNLFRQEDSHENAFLCRVVLYASRRIDRRRSGAAQDAPTAKGTRVAQAVRGGVGNRGGGPRDAGAARHEVQGNY